MKREISDLAAYRARASNISHVLATSRHAGVLPSSFMLKLLSQYKSGEISSAQVVEQMKAKHGIEDSG